MINLVLQENFNYKFGFTINIGGRNYITTNDIVHTDNMERIVIFNGTLHHQKDELDYVEKILVESNSTEEFLNRIKYESGEWSLLLIEDDTVYALTDFLGSATLYYNDNFEFSEDNYEISTGTAFDQIYKSKVLKWGYNMDNRTPFKDVKRVLPQKITKIENRIVSETYINTDDFMQGFENICTVDTYVHDAVYHQLSKCNPDEPIAVLLSGGLDSSIIAYELITTNALEFNNKYKLKFYTLDEDPEDVKCAKEFADMYKIQLNIISYDKEKVDLSVALRINKTPIDLGSMVPNQVLMRMIPEKVFFTGDGADCLFGGFRRIDKYDSQMSDMIDEHPFYYSPKGNNAANTFGVKYNCPFNDFTLVRFAFNLPLYARTHKKCLKEAYKNELPKSIIERKKLPLKTQQIVEDKDKYRYDLAQIFYNMDWTKYPNA